MCVAQQSKSHLFKKKGLKKGGLKIKKVKENKKGRFA